jgi:hypothetical protein
MPGAGLVALEPGPGALVPAFDVCVFGVKHKFPPG